MKKVKYLILGGGVSGLSFANNIGSDECLILEKESEPGGYCRTTRRNGYVWDFAGHFFHFSNAELKAVFEGILSSDETVLRKKNTKIYYHNSYIDYPFQKNIHQLPKEELIDCLYDLVEKEEQEQYGNFLDMLFGKFGRSITEKFLLPYNEKLYACDLKKLDVNAMGRFFPYADLKDIIRNMKRPKDSSYNQTFQYPQKGAAVFVEKLLEGIEEKNLHLGETAERIDLEAKNVISDRETYAYEHLISSIPLNHFARMAGLDYLNDGELLSYNQVLVFNLGFDRAAVDKEIHWLYFPDREFNFYRAGFYNNIIGSEKLSMYIEIGYPMEHLITQEEIAFQKEETLRNLRKAGIIQDHRLADSQAIVMSPAYVHITQRGLRAVEELKQEIAKNGVHLIGRYGGWKYCSIEDCMLEAINTAKEIQGTA